MKSVNPYLMFDGNALEAFNFYKSVFGGDFGQVVRFRDMPDTGKISEDWFDKLAHISLPLTAQVTLMGSDAPPMTGFEALTVGSNIALSIEPDSAAEAARLFEALAAGGKVTMPLANTGWSELYGQVTDRFDIQWMINLPG